MLTYFLCHEWNVCIIISILAMVTINIYYDLNIPIDGTSGDGNDMCILKMTMSNKIWGSTHKLDSYLTFTSIPQIHHACHGVVL